MNQSLVTSKVTKDGESEITQVQPMPQYNIKSGAIGADPINNVPEPPNINDLSKLFTPKFVAYVQAPDGTEIPFTYKKIDPGTLLQTVGIPNAVALHPGIAKNRLSEKAAELGIDLDAVEEEELSDDDPRAEAVMLLMAGEEMQSLAKFNEHCRREALKLCIVSPKMDDELYDNLAEEVKEGLYQVITGGVVNDNELIENFRENPEGTQ